MFAGGGGSAGGGGGGGGENYVPEDLISLLDAGINSDHPSVIIDADAMFSEEMFSYSGAGQQRATLARSSSSRYHMTRCSIIIYSYSLRRGPTGPSLLAPATQDKMHPFIIIKWS